MCRLVLAAALLAPLAGCPAPASVPPEPPEVEAPIVTGSPDVRSPDLDAARKRWEAAGVAGYQMTLRRICFCPSPDYTGPFEVTVRDGDIASVALAGVRVGDERGETVDDLFDLIEGAYEQNAEQVRVAFDPERGFPTEISIDYSMQLADEEIGYLVSDFRVADR